MYTKFLSEEWCVDCFEVCFVSAAKMRSVLSAGMCFVLICNMYCMYVSTFLSCGISCMIVCSEWAEVWYGCRVEAKSEVSELSCCVLGMLVCMLD